MEFYAQIEVYFVGEKKIEIFTNIQTKTVSKNPI